MQTLNFGGSLDYGLENGPILMSADQSLDQFTKSITSFDFDYDYSQIDRTYDSTGFWEDLANTTTGAAKDATGYVWNTAKGTWESVKEGAGWLADKAMDAVDGTLWFFLKWLMIILAVVVGALVILGKTGVLKDAAAFL